MCSHDLGSLGTLRAFGWRGRAGASAVPGGLGKRVAATDPKRDVWATG